MSDNKRKYWSVTTTQLISANTKRDALAKAVRRRGVDADVLEAVSHGERISAGEAQDILGLSEK